MDITPTLTLVDLQEFVATVLLPLALIAGAVLVAAFIVLITLAALVNNFLD